MCGQEVMITSGMWRLPGGTCICGTDDLPGIVGDNGRIIHIIGRSYDVLPTTEFRRNCPEEAKRDRWQGFIIKGGGIRKVERILKRSEPEKQHVLF